LVDPAALDEWRGHCAPHSTLRTVAAALFDVLMRDAGDGEPAWQALGIRRDRAAALLILTYARIQRTLLRDEPDELPAEIVHLWTICNTPGL
jgi:hypothetical protein